MAEREGSRDFRAQMAEFEMTVNNVLERRNSLQDNTLQYSTLQDNGLQYNNTLQDNNVQYNNTIQDNNVQYNTLQDNFWIQDFVSSSSPSSTISPSPLGQNSPSPNPVALGQVVVVNVETKVWNKKNRIFIQWLIRVEKNKNLYLIDFHFNQILILINNISASFPRNNQQAV